MGFQASSDMCGPVKEAHLPRPRQRKLPNQRSFLQHRKHTFDLIDWLECDSAAETMLKMLQLPASKLMSYKRTQQGTIPQLLPLISQYCSAKPAAASAAQGEQRRFWAQRATGSYAKCRA